MLAALEAGRHVVSLNAEVDATIGYLLHQVAREHGVVYTISDGDQPGGMLRTHAWVRAMGFEPVVIANCKRHLDRRQNPTTSAPYAERDGTSVEITTAAGDGTKLQIECAVVANAHRVRARLPRDARRAARRWSAPSTICVRSSRAITSSSTRSAATSGPACSWSVAPTTTSGGAIAALLQDGPRPRLPLPPPVHARAVRDARDDRRRLDQRPRTRHAGGATGRRSRHDGEARPPGGGVARRHRRIHCYGAIDTRSGATRVAPDRAGARGRAPARRAADAPVPLDAVEIDESSEIVALRRRQDVLADDVRSARRVGRT